MTTSLIGGVLEELQWKTGLSIPIANAENTQLLKQLEELTRQACNKRQRVETEAAHIDSMRSHLRDVRNALHETEALAGARGDELSSVKHLLKLIERENGRLKARIATLNREIGHLRERNNYMEVTAFEQKRRLQEEQETLHAEEDNVAEWFIYCSQLEDDYSALRRYRNIDASEFKDLNREFQLLRTKNLKERQKLDTTHLELKLTEDVLTGTLKHLRMEHDRRNVLLRQWEDLLASMEQRDLDLLDLNAEKLEYLREIHELERTKEEKKNFLKHEVNNNEEKEKLLMLKNAECAKFRSDLARAESSYRDQGSEFVVLRGTCQKAIWDLETTRCDIVSLSVTLRSRKSKKVGLERTLRRLWQTRDRALEELKNAEEYADMMEELLEKMGDAERKAQEEVQQLLKLRYAKLQEVQEARSFEKLTENTGLKRKRMECKKLRNLVHYKEHTLEEMEKILYQLELEHIRLERRINRVLGLNNTEEVMKKLQLKCHELERNLEEKGDLVAMLKREISKVDNCNQCLLRDIHAGTAALAKLSADVTEQLIHQDISDVMVKRRMRLKEVHLRESFGLKVQVWKLRKNYQALHQEVISLTRRGEDIKQHQAERMLEVKQHRDMMRTQLKEGQEDNDELLARLNRSITKRDTAKTKNDVLLSILKTTDGLIPDPIAYYSAKALKEIDELTKQGDRLDRQIRKAQVDLQALQNTLCVFNGCNHQLREKLRKVDPKGPESQRKRQFEDRYHNVFLICKKKMMERKAILEDFKQQRKNFLCVNQSENILKREIAVKEGRIQDINKETHNQRVKLRYLDSKIIELSRAIRGYNNEEIAYFREHLADIKVRELRSFNLSVLLTLDDVMKGYREIADIVRDLIIQAGMDVTEIKEDSMGLFSFYPRPSITQDFIQFMEDLTGIRREDCSCLASWTQAPSSRRTSPILTPPSHQSPRASILKGRSSSDAQTKKHPGFAPPPHNLGAHVSACLGMVVEAQEKTPSDTLWVPSSRSHSLVTETPPLLLSPMSSVDYSTDHIRPSTAGSEPPPRESRAEQPQDSNEKGSTPGRGDWDSVSEISGGSISSRTSKGEKTSRERQSSVLSEEFVHPRTSSSAGSHHKKRSSSERESIIASSLPKTTVGPQSKKKRSSDRIHKRSIAKSVAFQEPVPEEDSFMAEMRQRHKAAMKWLVEDEEDGQQESKDSEGSDEEHRPSTAEQSPPEIFHKRHRRDSEDSVGKRASTSSRTFSMLESSTDLASTLSRDDTSEGSSTRELDKRDSQTTARRNRAAALRKRAGKGSRPGDQDQDAGEGPSNQ